MKSGKLDSPRIRIFPGHYDSKATEQDPKLLGKIANDKPFTVCLLVKGATVLWADL